MGAPEESSFKFENAVELFPNDEEAENFLTWARSQRDLKVVTVDVPAGILPHKLKGRLHDVRVFSKRGPDDAIYDSCPKIREKVPRGACFMEISDAFDTRVRCITYALKKFTGGLGDDDDRSKDNQAWQNYFTQPIEETTKVICMKKANGEAAHLSACCVGGKYLICAGSKNVHMLFTNRDDLEKYGDGQRYMVAREVCETVIDQLDSMSLKQRQSLLEYLASNEYTGVFEILNPKHSHVEDLSHLKKPLLQFISWTKFEPDSSQLCSMPPNKAIQIARDFGLPTVDFEEISFNSIEDHIEKVRNMYHCEGEVLYFMTAEDEVIGLLKKKSVWYISCRAIREKIKGALCAKNRKKSDSEIIRLIEKRMHAIQDWLSLNDDVTTEWTVLGIEFFKWCSDELRQCSITTDDIANRFPIVWKRFLSETGRSDEIESPPPSPPAVFNHTNDAMIKCTS